MPRLFGSQPMRDLHYKKIQLRLLELTNEVKVCEESETSTQNRKRLKIAQKQLDSAFNNLAVVRG